MAVPPDSVPVGVTRWVETGASVGENQRWAQLDAVELNDWMLRRVPMLKTCPRFLRGRFRQCWATALRERCRARLGGDVVSESNGVQFCVQRRVDTEIGRCIETPSHYHHSVGRAETQRAGCSVTHPTWPGFPPSTAVDRAWYAELVENDRYQLVVVGIETGRRWNNEATSFIEGLAASRAREAPVAFFFVSRLAEEVVPHALSVSRAFGSLVSTNDHLTGTDGVAPELTDFLPQC